MLFFGLFISAESGSVNSQIYIIQQSTQEEKYVLKRKLHFAARLLNFDI